jgi:Flp pilus assembly protein TadD
MTTLSVPAESDPATTRFESQFQHARALLIAHRPLEAIEALEWAAQLAPHRPEPTTGRGIAYTQLRRYDAARAAFEQALAIAPKYLSALSSYAQLEVDTGRCDHALQLYERAIALAPTDPVLHHGVTRALLRTGLVAEALAHADWLVTRHPTNGPAHSIRGTAYALVGRHSEAEAAQRRAIELTPNDWLAHYNLAELLLARGEYAEGWREFEWRLQAAETTPATHYRAPRWAGEPLAGKTIIACAEQGLGDTLQCARYVPLLAGLGADVILEVQPALAGLLGALPGTVQVIAQDSTLPRADFSIPPFSLPRLFGTTLDTIPSRGAYLRADPMRVQSWRDRLPPAGKRVGLVWSGNPIQVVDRYRSIGLAPLAPLLGREKIHWIGFKPELDPHEAALIAARSNFTHIQTDLESVAAILVTLDQFVTTCTSLAHLAGALGVPTILMASSAADWRWLRDRADSPWYDSIRIVRQPTLGDWPSVVARVSALL